MHIAQIYSDERKGMGKKKRKRYNNTQSANTTLFLPHRGGSCATSLFLGDFNGFSLAGGGDDSWA